MSGKLVAEADNIAKHSRRTIVRDFSIRIQRGDRIGLVGPNGAGKTTLLKTADRRADTRYGTIKLGTNLAMVTLDQRRAALDPLVSVRDTLTGGAA